MSLSIPEDSDGLVVARGAGCIRYLVWAHGACRWVSDTSVGIRGVGRCHPPSLAVGVGIYLRYVLGKTGRLDMRAILPAGMSQVHKGG